MGKIPTAEEMFKANPILPEGIERQACIAFMKVFAKLHVEAALKAKVKAIQEKSYEDSSYSMGELDAFTRDSYPLENIK